MRRMRDFPWRYVFWPSLVAGIGWVVYIQLNLPLVPTPPGQDLSSKGPSQAPEAEEGKSEKQITEAMPEAKVHKKEHAMDTATREPASSPHEPQVAESTEGVPVEVPVGAKKNMKSKLGLKQLGELAASKVSENPEKGVPTPCAKLEYRGHGPGMAILTQEQWDKVMSEFHWAKNHLLAWLRENKKSFSDSTYAEMEKQVQSLKVQRPPTLDEPDLAWRGVGVWTHDDTGAPLVRLGGGFPLLVEKNQARARFELARLLAQAWTPCELNRISVTHPWNPLLQCLQITGQNGCSAGSYSEEAWAVSSTLAAHVADPGCVVPAFHESALSACMKSIPLASPTNESAQSPAVSWKEARR